MDNLTLCSFLVYSECTFLFFFSFSLLNSDFSNICLEPRGRIHASDIEDYMSYVSDSWPEVPCNSVF